MPNSPLELRESPLFMPASPSAHVSEPRPPPSQSLVLQHSHQFITARSPWRRKKLKILMPLRGRMQLCSPCYPPRRKNIGLEGGRLAALAPQLCSPEPSTTSSREVKGGQGQTEDIAGPDKAAAVRHAADGALGKTSADPVQRRLFAVPDRSALNRLRRSSRLTPRSSGSRLSASQAFRGQKTGWERR